jgi:Asp-tRNA(Asn)/Glu-tRNA(Gln) amidotransferase A subunit family amidase
MRAALIGMPHRRVDRTVGAPRIGICRPPAWDAAEPPVQALIEQSATRFAAAGARVSEVSFAPEFAGILDHHRRIFNYEAARNYAYEYEDHDQVRCCATRC